MHVQHHHLLARVELKRCPSVRQQAAMRRLIDELLRDVDMHKLGPLEHYDVRSRDPERRGQSWLVPIQTSHLALHFWSHPNARIMHSRGRCLLQLDLYTCNRLTRRQVRRVLELLGEFAPTHASVTLINRLRGLHIDRHDEWRRSACAWAEFAAGY